MGVGGEGAGGEGGRRGGGSACGWREGVGFVDVKGSVGKG